MQHQLGAALFWESGNGAQLGQGVLQYAQDRWPEVPCHDRYLQMADSCAIRGDHRCEFAGFAYDQIGSPIIDDLSHCRERRLSVKATKELGNDDAIGFLEPELRDLAEDLAEDVRSWLIEGQMGEARCADRLGEANRGGNRDPETRSHTGPGERDERAEVPRPSCRREQDAHDATLSRQCPACALRRLAHVICRCIQSST